MLLLQVRGIADSSVVKHRYAGDDASRPCVMGTPSRTILSVETSGARPLLEKLPQAVDHPRNDDEQQSSGTDERPTAQRGESGEHAFKCGRSTIRIPEFASSTLLHRPQSHYVFGGGSVAIG